MDNENKKENLILDNNKKSVSVNEKLTKNPKEIEMKNNEVII
jgi:hypothetical protein